MDKHGEFTVKNELTYGRGYVYSLQYHLVWCTKYRKKVLRDGIDTECREMLEEMAGEYKFTITAMEVGEKAVHQAPGAQEGAVGRAPVEPVLLCGDSQ